MNSEKKRLIINLDAMLEIINNISDEQSRDSAIEQYYRMYHALKKYLQYQESGEPHRIIDETC